MQLALTSKRQVTFPAHVLASLGVQPGGRIELHSGPQGFVLRAKVVDASRLAPLRGLLKANAGPFDIGKFRQQAHDSALRN